MGRQAALALGLVALVLAPAATPAAPAKAKKTIVLGVDGLDPDLLRRFIDEGDLPNFKRFIATGDFKPLITSMPPMSPIAWSNFITGMDPGGHGIYDFIHRRLDPFIPYSSMAESVEPQRVLRIGSRCLPARDLAPGFLKSESMINLRKGTAFWDYLERAGVPTTVFRMPVNFPPVETGGKAFSGMGTPDVRGSLGTFSYFSDLRPPNADGFTGGEFYTVQVVDGRVEASLLGPRNPFDCNTYAATRKPRSGSGEDLKVDFTVYLDPDNPIAKFEVNDQEFILREGEWSPWIRVDFEVVPVLASVSSIGRFYLKEVRPNFKLYVSPLQINPEEPAQPISTPDDWSQELFEDLGYFYTQQLPEDTKALSNHVFTGREFWDQAQIVFGERSRALDYFLDRFDAGLLFFYFSSVDQNSHMLWNYMDPEHPGHIDDEKLLHGIRDVYREIDDALGRVLDAIDRDTTLVVMSDHGFCPFYWQVNLNTWLLEKGYIALRNPEMRSSRPWFADVDWSRTKAYAAGLNGLYVNLRGREKQGIVDPADYDALLDRLEHDLLELRDPRNGRQAVTLALRPRRDFHGPYAAEGPDIIVGYNRGYRTSWKSPLGEMTPEVFQDNDDPWSGDHLVDYRLVPGVLISNHKITLEEPALYDLTVAILDEYGVAKTDEMIGEDCLGEPVATTTAAAASK